MLYIEIYLAKNFACLILASDVVDRLEKAIVTPEIYLLYTVICQQFQFIRVFAYAHRKVLIG